MLTFETVYTDYYVKVFKYIFHRVDQDSHYVQDIASKTFMVLIEKWESLNFEEKEGCLKYLYKVAKLKIKEYYREIARTPQSLDDPLSDAYKQYHEQMWFPYQDIDENARYMELAGKLRQELPEEDKPLFDMIVIKRYSKAQIARIYHVSPSAVGKRWKKIRKSLERSLIKYNILPPDFSTK